MDKEQFNAVTEKLDRIIKLLAVQSIGEKTGREAIKSLSSVGLQPKEIADLLGTTPNTVSVAINAMKKGGKKNAKKDKNK